MAKLPPGQFDSEAVDKMPERPAAVPSREQLQARLAELSQVRAAEAPGPKPPLPKFEFGSPEGQERAREVLTKGILQQAQVQAYEAGALHGVLVGAGAVLAGWALYYFLFSGAASSVDADVPLAAVKTAAKRSAAAAAKVH